MFDVLKVELRGAGEEPNTFVRCEETEVVMLHSVDLLQCALSRLKRLSRCQQSRLVVVLGSRLDLGPVFGTDPLIEQMRLNFVVVFKSID